MMNWLNIYQGLLAVGSIPQSLTGRRSAAAENLSRK